MELKSGTRVELRTHDGMFEIVGQWPDGQWILDRVDADSSEEVWVDVSEIKGAEF